MYTCVHLYICILRGFQAYRVPNLFAGISVGFEQTQYTVNENGTSVQVCVVLSKASMDTITVELALLDGTSATAGAVLSVLCI